MQQPGYNDVDEGWGVMFLDSHGSRASGDVGGGRVGPH